MVSKRVSKSRIVGGGGSHTWHQEPEQRPAGGRCGTATKGLWHQRREATRAQLPLTSAFTLEERKRGSDDATHQCTFHPRFRPAGLYG
jgi:hypothetical protein